ncbi:MAG: hypothetical protein WDN69_23990, partial [Aliidongia sp.]
MQEPLLRFFRAARGAGVRISPAESIDAMRAVRGGRLCRSHGAEGRARPVIGQDAGREAGARRLLRTLFR